MHGFFVLSSILVNLSFGGFGDWDGMECGLCIERGTRREREKREGMDKSRHGKCGVFVFWWRVGKKNIGDEILHRLVYLLSLTASSRGAELKTVLPPPPTPSQQRSTHLFSLVRRISISLFPVSSQAPSLFSLLNLLQPQSLPAGQTALQLPDLGLPVAQLRSLRFAHARVDFCLPARVSDQAALPLDPLVGLIQLLAELLDLSRQVHSALDLEEHRSRSADGGHHAAGRFRRCRVQDRKCRGRADFSGEGPDRGKLRRARFQRSGVEKLNVERRRVFDRVLGRDGADGL